MSQKTILITGGAGFIGSNCASLFIKKGWNVVVFDNLSRRGSADNLKWIKESGEFKLAKGDVRKESDVAKAFRSQKYDLIVHLAAQVAVTTSVQNPREDFDTNALGAFNVLEAVRRSSPEAFIIYSSTNKVYGKMESIPTVEKANCYAYANQPHGIAENYPLDFYSPYGCSKGAADQYVLDYARIYGLKTCVMRQSCIYGYRQFGTEDQGWVAWFTIASVLKKSVTIYGDGKQVRDILFADDLIKAYDMAYEHREKITGRAYNIGGGPQNVLSLLDLVKHLEKASGRKMECSFDSWRPGDQKVFVSDIRKAEKDFGWQPRTGVSEGLSKLWAWVVANKQLFKN